MKNSVLRLINLLVMAVPASLLSVSLLFASSVLIWISLILLTAIVDALLRPLMMICELTPCSTCSLISFKISPARTTTDVVPSPTSASCDRAISTRIRAAGWTMSRSFLMSEPNQICCRRTHAHLHDRCSIVGNSLPPVRIHH